jgi:hypothetical protein
MALAMAGAIIGHCGEWQKGFFDRREIVVIGRARQCRALPFCDVEV